MTVDPYRSFGVGYATQRRTDPGIGSHITRALADARTVINVGAGTGSYEPPSTVLAVEPSPTMIAQRPPGTAPVIRASAEAIPVPDDIADTALAVLTTHHWRDPAAGVAELVRVAERQVILTWHQPTLARDFWLVAEYLPQIAAIERHLACLNTITRLLDAHDEHVEVHPVPIPADCVDGILAAHWQRPEAYLDPAVRAASSGLAALPDHVLTPALHRLEDALETGRWHARHRHLLGRRHLDVGYRLIIARRRPSRH